MQKSESGNSWETSVDEVVNIFRGAVIAILPWLEKAHIPWTEDEAYDDWDNIVESLFNNIVCSSLSGSVSDEYNIAEYNHSYKSYQLRDYIAVSSRQQPNKQFAFISFISVHQAFDTVKVGILGDEECLTGYENIKYDDCEFIFMKTANGDRKPIRTLHVLL